MQVSITGQVHDSAGVAEHGRIEFCQAQRIDNGEFLITSSPAVAQVVSGSLKTLSGEPFKLPSNPVGTAVRIREILGGRTFEWWTSIPEEASVEYRSLVPVESSDVPSSVWGPPEWIANIEQIRDETVAAVEAGAEILETIGGIQEITQLVSTATDAASAAELAADRAEAAAAQIDVSELEGQISAATQAAADAMAKATAAASSVSTLSDLFLATSRARVLHRTKVHAGVLLDFFTITTGGAFIPGAVTRRLSDKAQGPALAKFKTASDLAAVYGDNFVANGSGWDTTTGVIRGPNFVEGVPNGTLDTGGSSQGRAAIGYCGDGSMRYYEATLGDTVAKMVADGVIHSWSWGPQLILNNQVFDYASSGGWGGLGVSTKSARTVLGQLLNGDIVVVQAYGVSGQSGLDVTQMAQALVGEGFRMAVLLDGGGSSSSAWEGLVAHPSSDTVDRLLPDSISFNAAGSGVINYAPVTVEATGAPYAGQLVSIERRGDRASINAILSGARTTPGNLILVDSANVPLWLRTHRHSSLFSASSGKTGLVGMTSRSIRLGSNYSDGFNNPDIAYSLPAFLRAQ